VDPAQGTLGGEAMDALKKLGIAEQVQPKIKPFEGSGLAEASVAKAGIKMLFPIVLFILPVLFVITLVPAIIHTMYDMQLLGGGR